MTIQSLSKQKASKYRPENQHFSFPFKTGLCKNYHLNNAPTISHETAMLIACFCTLMTSIPVQFLATRRCRLPLVRMMLK